MNKSNKGIAIKKPAAKSYSKQTSGRTKAKFSAAAKAKSRILQKKERLMMLIKRLPAIPPLPRKTSGTRRPARIFRPSQSRNIQVTPNGSGQNEPSIDIKRNFVLVTANDYRAGSPRIGLYRSQTSGTGFTNRVLPLPVGFTDAGDGTVAFGTRNLAIVAGIVFNRDQNGNGIDGSIVVYRSSNNGRTFSAPIIINRGSGFNPFLDKPTFAIDRSTRQNNVYISYTSFFQNSSVILFQRSTNGGKTWSNPIVLSNSSAGATGTSTVVGPSGEVYIGWMEFTSSGVFFRVRRSDDGGVTFGNTATVSQVQLVPSPLPVPGFSFRIPTFAFLGVDTSRKSSRGTVYAVWQDNSGGSANILFSRSFSSGGSWSFPAQINNSGAGTQNFFPNIAVSRSNGSIKVIYYTNRLSPSLLDVFVAESNNSGDSFRNRRVSDTSFNPNADTSFGNPSTFIGDYIGISILGSSGFIGVWCDTRTGSQDIFAGRARSGSGAAPVKRNPVLLRAAARPIKHVKKARTHVPWK